MSLTMLRRLTTPCASQLGRQMRFCRGVSPMKTGTEFYMSLYPEGSTDGGLRLGNIVPDFKADTTQGSWESFHSWNDSQLPWVVSALKSGTSGRRASGPSS